MHICMFMGVYRRLNPFPTYNLNTQLRSMDLKFLQFAIFEHLPSLVGYSRFPSVSSWEYLEEFLLLQIKNFKLQIFTYSPLKILHFIKTNNPECLFSQKIFAFHFSNEKKANFLSREFWRWVKAVGFVSSNFVWNMTQSTRGEN